MIQFLEISSVFFWLTNARLFENCTSISQFLLIQIVRKI